MVSLLARVERAAGSLWSQPWPRLLGIGAVLRLLLVVYGEWQDANLRVKYTDIDYIVFSDASRFLLAGGSAYDRATYRYTPLLAWLLTPNILLHKAWGKVLFCLADVVICLLLRRMLLHSSARRCAPQRATAIVCVAWLFNPIVINVSSRGNAESLVCLVVVLTLYLLQQRAFLLSAVVYGFSVHFKLYPILYSLPIFLALDPPPYRQLAFLSPVRVFSWPRVLFTGVSASTFFALTGLMYWAYGWVFIDQTYAYHLYRTDARHNFSVFFYHLYLSGSSTADQGLGSAIVGLSLFLPQLALLLGIAAKFADDLPFCLLLQTIVFVAFNKVMTAQYFLWFLVLVPLVVPASSMPRSRFLFINAMWWLGELLWLSQAYRLEFLGHNTFLAIWAAGLLFFAAHVAIVHQVIRHHRTRVFLPWYQEFLERSADLKSATAKSKAQTQRASLSSKHPAGSKSPKARKQS